MRYVRAPWGMGDAISSSTIPEGRIGISHKIPRSEDDIDSTAGFGTLHGQLTGSSSLLLAHAGRHHRSGLQTEDFIQQEEKYTTHTMIHNMLLLIPTYCTTIILLLTKTHRRETFVRLATVLTASAASLAVAVPTRARRIAHIVRDKAARRSKRK